MDIQTLTATIDGLGGKATINSLVSKTGAKQNEVIKALFDASKAGKLDSTLSESGILTVTPSRRVIKAVNRAHRKSIMGDVQAAVLAFLGTQAEPVGIGDVVAGLGRDPSDKAERALVLEACRLLRKDGSVVTHNHTGSNFHASWSLPGVEFAPEAPPAEKAPKAKKASKKAAQGKAAEQVEAGSK